MIGIFANLSKYATSFKAFLVTSLQEKAFIRGEVFSYEDYMTYSTGEVKDFIFDPTAFSGENLVVEPPQFSATAGPVLVEYFINVIESGDGTVLDASNRRGTSSKTPEATLKVNPTTITDIGTRFAGRLVPATALTPVNKVGDTAGSSLPFEIDTQYKYMIRVTNTNGDDTIIQEDLTWTESKV